MKKYPKKSPLESEDHHWWPKCVSKHWKNDQGFIYRMTPAGTVDPYKKHKKLGYISNAHSIKFSNKPTAWDESYEHYFDAVDNNKGFPSIIKWLRSLENNYNSQKKDNENINILFECLLSLVIRSPRFRNQIKNNIGRFSEKDPNELLVNLNQRDTFEKFKGALINREKSTYRGKFAVVLSNEHEFIFGDGFYQNFISSVDIPAEPRMMVPLLPDVCILYSCPAKNINTKPRLIVTEFKDKDVGFINQTTMVYSKDDVFYRSQKPAMIKDFSCNKFLRYSFDGDPVINAFSNIFN